MSSICPYCNKRVYFAERQFYKGKDYHMICHGLLVKEELAAAPKVFAIHEQIFCNPEENVKHSYPLAPTEQYLASLNSPPTSPRTCSKCNIPAKSLDARFCTQCGGKF
ncbi:hypothetical protein SAMD00019534_053910, partial [Acytostelium subglobosum LB1]|uniref:hypothetical protein n=1 Tax=Acytostelium subglobosum LB1 TaxID=1410327 RepID=UPI000644FC7A